MTIPCPVAHNAQVRPQSLALSSPGVCWTWAQLEAQVQRVSAGLTHHGVVCGDTVAVLGSNTPLCVALFFAAARLNVTLGMLNPRLTAAELAPLLARLRPRLCVLDEALAPPAGLPGTWVTLQALAHSAPAPRDFSAVHLTPSLVHAVLFTSGTTGIPKGAMITVANLHAAALASAHNLGALGRAVWLGTLPLFHVGGLAMAWRCFLDGGTLVLHPRFDAVTAVEAILTQGITHASLVPTTLQRLVEHLNRHGGTTSLRAVLVGGGPLTPAWMDAARAVGVPVVQTYGLTEACSQVCTQRPGSVDHDAGPPLRGTGVRIVDARRAPLPAGTVGDIEVCGPTVMAGYWDDTDATQAALPDAWLRTGDLGELGATGNLTVHSRRVDLILRGGENVYPAEIERVLGQHPMVMDVAVLGQPHGEWGQEPVAAVVVRRPVPPEELRAWCQASLARFKVPAVFHFVDTLPRNAMGKVNRAALRGTLGLAS